MTKTRKVIGKSMCPEGDAGGSCNNNTMLKPLLCYVKFPDGKAKEHSDIIIAQKMLTREDSDRFIVILLKVITKHKKDDPEFKMADKYVITFKGR